MRIPDTPPDERDRLAELEQLGILDTPAEERFDRYTRLVKRLFDVPIALVSLVDADRQWFKSKQGLDVEETSREVSFCGHAILQTKPLVVEDASSDNRFVDNPLVRGDPNIRFYAGFPLRGPGGHAVGTLCVIDQRPRSFSEQDIETLSDIGAMVARELASVQLAITDELTGISNRRGFEILCAQLLALAARSEISVSLLMIDLDEFKRINDEYGHEAGDRALIEFSNCLIRNFRESDVIARLSGDEFSVLMSDADEAEAAIAVNRLNAFVQRGNAERGKGFQLRFSWGVARYHPGNHKNIGDVLKEADRLMYDNKRATSDRRNAG